MADCMQKVVIWLPRINEYRCRTAIGLGAGLSTLLPSSHENHVRTDGLKIGSGCAYQKGSSVP